MIELELRHAAASVERAWLLARNSVLEHELGKVLNSLRKLLSEDFRKKEE